MNRIPPEQRLIFALDVASPGEARELVLALQGRVRIFKVGLEVFLADGPALISFIGKQGAQVFLDLKLLDIPATVAAALAVVAKRYPQVLLVTVHTLGGLPPLKNPAGAPANLKILGVTLLTSMGPAELKRGGIRLAAGDYVAHLTGQALEMGCDGVIASGQEAARLRREFGGDFLIVTPGIRPSWAQVAGDDQQRTATPRQAILDGADYLVVGRPIRTHPDGPAAAAEKIQAEIRDALAE